MDIVVTLTICTGRNHCFHGDSIYTTVLGIPKVLLGGSGGIAPLIILSEIVPQIARKNMCIARKTVYSTSALSRTLVDFESITDYPKCVESSHSMLTVVGVYMFKIKGFNYSKLSRYVP